MSSRRRGLVAAMEELEQEQIAELNNSEATTDPEVEEPQPDQPETVVVEFPEADETPEAAQAEIQVAETEVEDTEEQIDEATEVAEELDNVADIVERSNENGGLDQTGAELLNATLESLYGRVGLKVEGRIIPSIESFGGLSSRMRSTRVSVEEIRKRASMIKDKVIEAIVNLWNRIQAFFQQIFTQVGRFHSRIEKLKEIHSQVPDTIVVDKFEDQKIANAVAKGGIPTSNLIRDIDSSYSLLNNAQKFVKSLDSEVKSKYTAIIKDSGDASKQEVAAKLEEFFESVIKSMNANSFINNTTTSGDRISGPLLGNKYFKLQREKTVGKFVTLKAKIVLESDDKNVSSELKTLTKNECASALDSVTKLISVIENYKETQKTINQTINGLKTTAKMSRTKNTDGEDDGSDKIFDTVMPVVTLMTYTPRVSVSYAASTASAVLTYVEKSLKNHIPAGDSLRDKVKSKLSRSKKDETDE